MAHCTLSSLWQRVSHVKSILGGNSRLIIKLQPSYQYSHQCRFELRRGKVKQRACKWSDSRGCRHRSHLTAKIFHNERCPRGDSTFPRLCGVGPDLRVPAGPVLERIHHGGQRHNHLHNLREPLDVMCERFNGNLQLSGFSVPFCSPR